MPRRAEFLIVWATALVAGLAAWALVHNGGRYCYRDGQGVIRACTRHNVPDTQADEMAKQMLPTPDALTVYIVRTAASDVADEVLVEVAGQQVASTVPLSLIRIELPPGEHPLTLSHDTGTDVILVSGREGEVRTLLMRGDAQSPGPRHRWEAVDLETARRIAGDARLVIDAQLP